MNSNKEKPMNGFVLYRGPSLIDGKPIVVIATGLEDGGWLPVG